MPILNITIVGNLPSACRQGLASRLADAAERALEVRPGAAWVLVTRVARSDYAEAGGGPPAGVLPVFVRVLQRVAPRGARLARQVAALTEAVAGCCGRPATNVHVLHEPSAEGRMAFGGTLVPRAVRVRGRRP